MGEAGGRIEHEQAQADNHHGRGDDAADAHEPGACRVAEANEHRRHEGTAAQAGEEEIPCDDGSPNRFVGHLNHLT